MSEDLRTRIAAEIRRELADEAAAGFPLLRRLPASQTAGVPAFFAGLSADEREGLLDGLVWHATHEWSYQQRQELSERLPAMRRLALLQPAYPKGDWYGARPKKAKLKKAVAERFFGAGFARRRLERPMPDRMDFTHPDGVVPGFVLLSFDTNLLNQLDYGLRNWLRPDFAVWFKPSAEWKSFPVLDLDYYNLWLAHAGSGGVNWELITEENLEEACNLLMETVARLTALAARINALEVPSP